MPGVLLHFIQRGNDHQRCFFTDADHPRYRSDLREVAMREGCSAHAHVRMTNYLHLCVTPKTARAISRLMQSLGRRYVRYINDRHRRTDTLCDDRYKAPRRKRQPPDAVPSLHRTQSAERGIAVLAKIRSPERWTRPGRPQNATRVTI
jgi:REP element-mobilizing transposase RayT